VLTVQGVADEMYRSVFNEEAVMTLVLSCISVSSGHLLSFLTLPSVLDP
jgi:hypothetical protein